MAKINEDKAAMYLVAIVGVVATVGILVLLMNVGVGSSNDVSGEAYKVKSISGTKGSISSTNTVESEKCCDYTPDGHCIPKCH